jgi:uncharacterized membrane protein YphA (DoxX/SURF4 family)
VGGWILTILLVAMFCAAGLPKLSGSTVWHRMFANWGYSRAMVPIVGILECLGALALLHRRTVLAGSAILAVIMLGAGYTHISAREGYQVLRPTVFSWADWNDSLAAPAVRPGIQIRPPRIFSSSARYVRLNVSFVPFCRMT